MCVNRATRSKSCHFTRTDAKMTNLMPKDVIQCQDTGDADALPIVLQHCHIMFSLKQFYVRWSLEIFQEAWWVRTKHVEKTFVLVGGDSPHSYK